jgi:hypothetical protein
VVLPIAKIATFDEVLELPRPETASGVGELEGPQEVGGLLEVGPNGVDFVDKVLDADDTELAQVCLNDLIVSERDALLVDLAITTLVNQLADVLERGVSVGDVRLDDLEHLSGGLGDFDEDAIVDLEESQELQRFALLGVDLVDTEKGQTRLVES